MYFRRNLGLIFIEHDKLSILFGQDSIAIHFDFLSLNGIRLVVEESLVIFGPGKIGDATTITSDVHLLNGPVSLGDDGFFNLFVLLAISHN